MNIEMLISNLTNPTLLFFLLGIIAVSLKSDLKIPQTSSKFISLYLLFSIGFKGGQELAHSSFNQEIVYAILLGLIVSALVPLYTFYILKRKMSVSDAGAVAASYGSVSAVTFLAAASFLEAQNLQFGGHMVAIMAFMESPAIIVGVFLIMKYQQEKTHQVNMGSIIKHSISNGSVLMLLGSLIIGFIADTKQAEGIKPFTTDIFKGFLAIFLLEMGMVTAKRFNAFRKYGFIAFAFAVIIPFINGTVVSIISGFFIQHIPDRFMLAVLSASASYIAVPAAMRLAAPKADPGLYVPMALGVTFPFNITAGLPYYFFLVNHT